jgi:hypothetical protein
MTMNSFPRYTHGVSLGLAVVAMVAGLGLTAPAKASRVGSVQVMEVEDVRNAANIARAKARNRSEAAENGGFGGGVFSSGCSDLNIGNVKTGVGQTVPRNVTIVIEGPVIQENKCR